MILLVGQGVWLSLRGGIFMLNRIVAGCLIACLFACVSAGSAQAGLSFVTHGKSNRIIIFIDGLQSDPAKSFRWGDGVGSWPELMAGDLTAENKQLPLARYDTAILSFDGASAGRATIPQLATRGLAELNAKSVIEGYSAIAFVAHGAGGLVLKSMIVQSALTGTASLAAKTRVVFLLSVPAEGPSAANFLAALAQNQSLAVNFGTTDVAVFLQGLGSLWSEFLSRRGPTRRLEVYCRTETEASFGLKVASGQYTTEGCDDSGQEAGTDHNSIARPASRDAGIYRWVRRHLADYFERFPSDPGKAKSSLQVATAEGSTTTPAMPSAPPAATSATSTVAEASPVPPVSNDLSPTDSTGSIASAPPMAITPSPASSTARSARSGGRPFVGSPRSGNWTFSLKGADCNLTQQLWVVRLHERELTSDSWNVRLAGDGKFTINNSSACGTELVRGRVAGTVGSGWYLYADPCHAIYCRTRFKMTWRLPIGAHR